MAIPEWASDVPVSAPSAPSRPIAVSFGGFAFTTHGLAHEITDADREELLMPTFAPQSFRRGAVS